MTRVLPAVSISETERFALSDRVKRFISENRAPAQVITTGLDGQPRIRLMGVWTDGFRSYIISRKPTHKQAELERDPRITLVWYRYDVDEPGIDQPLRQVIISGRAELLLDAAAMRAMPFYDQTVALPRRASDPPNRITLESNDADIEAVRFGIVVHPVRVRVEGFVPGPRYPISLDPGA